MEAAASRSRGSRLQRNEQQHSEKEPVAEAHRAAFPW